MNWMRFQPLYFSFSGIALALSVYAILAWGFKPSIDFTGGSVVEYRFENAVDIKELQIAVESKTSQKVVSLDNNSFQVRFGPIKQEEAESLADNFPQRAEIVKFETVGPTLSREILQKTYFAVAVIGIGILLLIAWQFKNIRFGVFAIAALLHDLVILLGVFAFLGRFQGVEVDILVVTAFLTILSLSLYDTVVVYDRIRESLRKFPDAPFMEIANRAISGTIVRSLNTSFTTSFVLLALFLIGGVSIKWFVFALLVGTISGTYSSPFVAVPLLVVWDKLKGGKR